MKCGVGSLEARCRLTPAGCVSGTYFTLGRLPHLFQHQKAFTALLIYLVVNFTGRASPPGTVIAQ